MADMAFVPTVWAMNVDEWFETTNNPLAEVMQAVRQIIIAEPDVTETVKY